jgi:hypothetical protein
MVPVQAYLIAWLLADALLILVVFFVRSHISLLGYFWARPQNPPPKRNPPFGGDLDGGREET